MTTLSMPTKSERKQPPAKVQAKNTYAKAGKYKATEIRVNGQRPITLEEACARYINRFTREHVPGWALLPVAKAGGKYRGPYYRTDQEWYNNTEFLGHGTSWGKRYIREYNRSYPFGQWLDKPYTREEALAFKEHNTPVPVKMAQPTLAKPTKRDVTAREERKRQRRLKQFEINVLANYAVIETVKRHKPDPKKSKKAQRKGKNKKPAKTTKHGK